MAKVRVELESAGIQALLKSSEIADICEAQARKMTQVAGFPYVADVHVGRTRVNASGTRRGEPKDD